MNQKFIAESIIIDLVWWPVKGFTNLYFLMVVYGEFLAAIP